MIENASFLIILRPKDGPYAKRHIIFVESPQARARNEPYLELPKGALDASGNMTGPLVEKMYEEIGMKLRKDDLTNLTSMVLQYPHCKQGLQSDPDSVIDPAYINPDRPLILWEKRLDSKAIAELTGRFGEQGVFNDETNFRILDSVNLWKAGARNAELMAAYAMYKNLNIHGYIAERLHQMRIEAP